LLAGGAFDATLRAAGHTVRSVFIDADAAPTASYDAAYALADSADVVIVSSHIAQRWDATTIAQSRDFVEFTTKVAARPQGAVVVAFGNPYLLQQIPTVSSYLVAWSGTSAAQRAAARALVGAAPITGRLPITIPPLAAVGAGVQRSARAP
jgi:beta-N-acetylhexosaminidase